MIAPRPIDRPTIAHVVHGLGVGGAEVLVSRIARRLSDRFRFVFACLDDVGELGRQLAADGYAVHHVGRRPGVDLRCARRLGRWLREQHVDVVHAHQYTPFLQSCLARFPRSNRPILFTEHGRHHPDVASWRRRTANRLLLGRRDHVVGVGEGVRRALVSIEGLPEQRVGVVHNGIDLRPFGQTDDEVRRDARRELGLDGFVVAMVARLDPVKDHATALSAFADLRERRPRAHLLVVGDGEERDAIKAHVRRLNLGDTVHLLGTRHDVPRLLAASDVGLLTSHSEGIPLCLVEAFAAGLPVVSTDVGGTSEVVEHGGNGLLVPAGDAMAVSRALQRIADDPEFGRRLGRAGRIAARDRFSEPAMLDAYAAIYEEMLA